MRSARGDLPPGVEAYDLPLGGLVPNNPLPLVVMREAVALDPDNRPATLEDRFRANGWTGAWRNGIFPYDHFHSTAHEVLGIASGTACVRFGGEEGREVEFAEGDVVVIPAGVGHKLITEGAKLLVVGAYAGGRSWDIVRPSQANLEGALARIAAVPMPETDPVAGAGGPLLQVWGPRDAA